MGQETPCGTCPIPSLLEENEVVWELFTILSTQVRSDGFGTLLGYDLAMLPTLFAAYEVPQRSWKRVVEGLHTITLVAIKLNREQIKEQEKRTKSQT